VQLKFQRIIDIAAIALAGTALAVTASGCAHHQHGHHGHTEGSGLTVTGSGEAKSKPDIARSSIGIEVRAETAEQATAQASERMNAVLAAIKGAGVADTDLRTHDFSVQFERDYTPPPLPVPPPPPVKPGAKAAPAAQLEPAPSSVPRGSYRVSNTVEVTIRDISKVSAVLTAATSAGANNVWGINFDVENQDPLHDKARAQAIEKAKRNAEQLAQLTGVKLGAIVTIEDQADSGQIAPRMFKAAMMAESADASQVPVEGGELTITHQVRLVYALDKR
jgi:uncharacterized protein YggE